MIDYLVGLLDLKGIINGLISAALFLAVTYYWTRYRTKSIQHRLEAAQMEAKELEYLANSETQVFLLGFKFTFLVLGLMCINFALEASDVVKLTLFRDGFFDGFALSRAIFWWLITALSLFIAGKLHRVSQYPRSAKEIEKKIEKLKSKLTRNHR